jgi:hypothetical protein
MTGAIFVALIPRTSAVLTDLTAGDPSVKSPPFDGGHAAIPAQSNGEVTADLYVPASCCTTASAFVTCSGGDK